MAVKKAEYNQPSKATWLWACKTFLKFMPSVGKTNCHRKNKPSKATTSKFRNAILSQVGFKNGADSFSQDIQFTPKDKLNGKVRNKRNSKYYLIKKKPDLVIKTLSFYSKKV